MTAAERETGCFACRHPEHSPAVCGASISNQGYDGPCRCGEPPTREEQLRQLLGLTAKRGRRG